MVRLLAPTQHSTTPLLLHADAHGKERTPTLVLASTLRRIVPPAAKRVAPEDSPGPTEYANEQSVLQDGLDHVVTASGRKPALPPDEGAERHLVKADGGDQQPCGKADESFPEKTHGDFLSSFRATLPASLGRESFKTARQGSAPRRGETTRSTPAGIRARVRRNAVRINRFQRFRITAEPTARGMAKPSRG